MSTASKTATDTEDALTVIIEKSTLQQVIDQLQSIVSEARIRLGNDGLHVEAVDPANVAMVELDLDPSAFEYVGDGQYVFGLDLDRLEDYLSNATSGDLIEISFDPETRRLHIEHTTVAVDMAGIDPGAVRSVQDKPSLDPPATVVLEGDQLQTAVETADLVADHVLFTADADAEHLLVSADGDMDTIETELDRDDVIDASVPETVESLFSTDYLAGSGGMLAPIPKDTEATVHLDDEMPVTVDYEFADGDGWAELFLAPHIEST
jgi:proliferating cell nuclear antigen